MLCGVSLIIHGVPPRKIGDNFFALGALYCGAPLWGGVIWGKSVLVLGGRGDIPSFSSVHPSQRKSACSWY